jgi:hypothetical protein
MCPQPSELSVVLSEKINTLSKLNFEKIMVFPDMKSEDMTIEGQKLTLMVWHDVLPSQEHRIAVQLCKPSLAGLWVRIISDGFVVNRQNEKRPLSKEERTLFE